MLRTLLIVASFFMSLQSLVADDVALTLATFEADVTPPLGSPLCDGLVPPAEKIVDRLSARGVVLFGAGKPIVMCAVDWVGIGNGGHDAWRTALADAARTSIDRVVIHTLHQHDAPGCDFTAEEMLAQRGLSGQLFHVLFAREAITRTADAIRAAANRRHPVTDIGVGQGRVEMVASNRRILGPDGKVKFVRYSSCQDEAVRAEPEGTIDPFVRLISFWNGDTPLASLTYYATHPQSYYGQGGVSADFVGMARGIRETELPAFAHIHFNGASGNVAAGKYNDGSPEMRPALADRLAKGMQAAWESAKLQRRRIAAADLDWRSTDVALPVRDLLNETKLAAVLDNKDAAVRDRTRAARDLAFLRRCGAGQKVTLACLRLGSNYVVHMPGELFIEYQLAAQQVRPKDFVCMAAYGDYGPGYIGTKIAYSQGGYETGPVSRTAPDVENVLLVAIRQLLR